MPKKKLQPKIDNKIKFIILNFGHVESSYPFSWIFKHNDIGFKTRLEAAKSLAIEFYLCYIEKHPIKQVNQCCLKAKAKNDKFCNECGYRIIFLEDDLSFAEPYKIWLLENCNLNHNDSEISEYFSEYSIWPYIYDQPFGITKENSLLIGSAEKILTGLLYKSGVFTDEIKFTDEIENTLNEDILNEILGNTTIEKFEASFENEEGPNVY